MCRWRQRRRRSIKVALAAIFFFFSFSPWCHGYVNDRVTDCILINENKRIDTASSDCVPAPSVGRPLPSELCPLKHSRVDGGHWGAGVRYSDGVCTVSFRLRHRSGEKEKRTTLMAAKRMIQYIPRKEEGIPLRLFHLLFSRPTGLVPFLSFQPANCSAYINKRSRGGAQCSAYRFVTR